MELQHAVFNSDLFFILVGIKNETPYMPEPIEVDGLELVLKDLNDLLL